jgi:hypothetical protein
MIANLFHSIGLVGTKGRVQIHEEWVEPIIIWFIVAARKGEKKSPALRRITDPILRLQEEIQAAWLAEKEENGFETTNHRQQRGQPQATSSAAPPQLLIDLFSMEELHGVMKRNDGQVSRL